MDKNLEQRGVIDALDLDDLNTRLHFSVELFHCVEELLTSGMNTAESYVDALAGAIYYLDSLSAEFRGMIEKSLEGKRDE